MFWWRLCCYFSSSFVSYFLFHNELKLKGRFILFQHTNVLAFVVLILVLLLFKICIEYDVIPRACIHFFLLFTSLFLSLSPCVCVWICNAHVARIIYIHVCGVIYSRWVVLCLNSVHRDVIHVSSRPLSHLFWTLLLLFMWFIYVWNITNIEMESIVKQADTVFILYKCLAYYIESEKIGLDMFF